MLRLQHERTEPERLQWSRAAWQRFEAESAGLSAYGAVVATILCSTLLLAWGVGDFDHFPQHAMRFTYFRVAAIVWCIFMALAAAKLQRPRAKLFAIWLGFLGWAVGGAVMIPYTPEHLLSHSFVLVIVQIASVGFMVWSRKWGFTMSVAVLGIGELALWRVPQGGYDTYSAHAYLLTGGLLCVLFTAVKYRGAREQFDQRMRLQEEKQKSEALLNTVSDLRAERLTWLENLARFLRHELKNQVVAVSTSLELTNQTDLDTTAECYVDRAQRSLGRMRRLVESATEATSLEAALVMEEIGPVELSEVVAERVTLFREANTARRFHADVEPEVLVDGNEDRLAQLLDKLLKNAVEHGFPDGEIRVTLRRQQGRASILVENDGDLLPAQREDLFDAFVTVGKQRAGHQNTGLGLIVAKAIAESHGGTIEARDREDGSGACFEIRIPAEVI